MSNISLKVAIIAMVLVTLYLLTDCTPREITFDQEKSQLNIAVDWRGL